MSDGLPAGDATYLRTWCQCLFNLGVYLKSDVPKQAVGMGMQDLTTSEPGSQMEASWNMATPKSSILVGFPHINHPAMGVPPWLWKLPSQYFATEFRRFGLIPQYPPTNWYELCEFGKHSNDDRTAPAQTPKDRVNHYLKIVGTNSSVNDFTILK